MWIIKTIKSSYTHLTYDVYFNNDTFEVYKSNTGDNQSQKEQSFKLKREKLPAHQTKRSLLTMLGKKEVDE